jgi:hypothetical protein
MAQRRIAKRHVVKFNAIIVAAGGVLVGECMMADVSEGGARITQLGSTEAPDKFDLILTRNGKVRRCCEVVWRSGRDIGIRLVREAPVQDEAGKDKVEA